MIKFKNNIDEMQEQKLLKIERNGCWLAYWGLVVAIIIQTVLGYSFQDLMGEQIVFMCLAIYIFVDCIRNGIEGRTVLLNAKGNILISGIGAVCMGILYFVISYIRYEKLAGSIATAIIMFLSTFLLLYVALAITTALLKNRVKKIEKNLDEENKEA